MSRLARLAFAFATLAPALASAAEKTTAQKIDEAFGGVVGVMAGFLFWVPIKALPIPLIVMVLMFGAVFYTFWYGFLNIRGFKHAIDVTRGKYDNPNDPGEISHFQALTSALSATVGLGNIAGVAVAVGMGGPGAVFWMMVLGVFGMSAKLHECTLAQLYRRIEPDGTVHGGPMYYLEVGIKEQHPSLAPLGKVLAIIFAAFCVMGSFGGGNMFQANQSFAAMKAQLPFLAQPDVQWAFGIFLAAMVGLVIIGGIKKIGQVTEKIIPLMVGIYLIAGVVVLYVHASAIPAAFKLIFTEAFNVQSLYGGIVGILVQGIKRAVFSNEAGIGSAAIAHSAAKTDEPVREGVVAMLGPFIDTVVICSMTAAILIVTGTYNVKAEALSQPGPFAIGGQTIALSVNGKEAKRITFKGGTLSATQVAGQLDKALEGAKAFARDSKVLIRSEIPGQKSVITVENLHKEAKGPGKAAAALGFPAKSAAKAGIELTRKAFASVLGWFPWVLAICVLLFAYSTMISWSYYGEKAWAYLFGRTQRNTMIYRGIFLVFVVLGTVASLGNVIDFSDLMILSMAFPNILGGLLLAKPVREKISSYWDRYKAGTFKVYK